MTSTVEGEAVFAKVVWEFCGASLLTGGGWASSALGVPGRPAEPSSAAASNSATPAAQDHLRAGTADAYGVGGFTATLTVNGRENTDDAIRWRPEAFINTAP